MPHLSGREMYQKLARQDPRAAERIIFATGDTVRGVAAARVPLHEVPWTIGLDPRAWWRLFLHVKAFQPAIIHAHDGHALGIATWAGAWLMHDAAAPRLIATRRVVFAVRRASALYRADYIVAISEAVNAALVAAGVPPAEIGVVRL